MVIGEKTAKEVRRTAHAMQDSVLFDTVAKPVSMLVTHEKFYVCKGMETTVFLQ